MSNISNVTNEILLSSHTIVNDIVIAIAIFLVGLIIGRIVGKLVGRFFKNFGIDELAKKRVGIKFSFEKFSSGLISFVIYLIFFIIALNYIGITSILLNIISFIIVVIIGIAVILSVRDSIPNIIAYRKITKKSTVKINDHIEFDNIKGIVKEINTFETQIETASKDIVHVPNSMFVNKMFIRKKRKTKK
jgi:small-conductance mechanosensitive channel